ncbi:ABC transporter permease [Paenibacillus nasutitermitis]|nr:ABC transporter permease subunit [Paenibacillus nasutitermitis]
MLLPAFLLVLIYSYLPIAGLVIAFQRYSPLEGFLNSPWAGWDNFTYALSLPDTMNVIGNTLYIAGLKVIANLVVPLIVALLLNELRLVIVKRWVQTLIYLPHFLSWVILAGILTDILSPSDGLVNHVLTAVGLDPIYFLGSNAWFPPVLILSDVWKEFGFGTIIFLAALTGINPSLYEAALMDGANRWKQTIHITLPGIVPIIVLLATLSLGNVLNAGFDQVFNLYNPTVYQSGDILDTLIYRIGIQNTDYSVATALGLFKSVVSFILISCSYWAAYRFANYRIF